MGQRVSGHVLRLASIVVVAVIGFGWWSPAATAATTLSSAPSYSGDFPDPFVLEVDGTYYAYSTQVYLVSVPVMTSTNLLDWTPIQEALPDLPAWASWGHTWAPSILPLGQGYVLYYTVREAASDRQCISTAIADDPAGPFVDDSSGPLLCQLDDGGSIDPEPFVDDDGRVYLLWKSDNNALGQQTHLWSQELSADGRSLVGAPVELLAQTARWQRPAIEGPSMVRTPNGEYVLFYGANRWDTSDAAIGYATCTSPSGPCVDQSTRRPWLASRSEAAGPSGPSVFTDASGALRLAYHAWDPAKVGYESGGVRSLWIDPLAFDRKGAPVLGESSSGGGSGGGPGGGSPGKGGGPAR